MRVSIDTRGIGAIKVWPFDGAAYRSGAGGISTDVDRGYAVQQSLRLAKDRNQYEVDRTL